MNEIRTEITLEAPVKRIWELLADCTLYPHWNPVIKQAAGKLVEGEHLKFVVALIESAPFEVNPKVLSVEPEKSFCWQQTAYCAGIFHWKYCVCLEVLTDEKLIFMQKLTFGGIIGPLFTLAMKSHVASGLERMNEAVRRWGEKGNIRCLKC
ncbi:MAG: SRPBCC domain-containing protein [Desulfuromonadaceae bacterium]|nr:SRPBCC domain-containing protein [Desulfuromonadaceae bacterium]